MLPFNLHGPLAGIARRYAWTVPIVAVLGLAGSALEGIGIGLLIPLLVTLMAGDDMTLGGPLKVLATFANRFSPETRLVTLTATIFSLIVLKNVVVYVTNLFAAAVDGHASHRIRSALSAQLLSVAYPFLLAEDSARLLNVITTESWRASEAIRALFSAVAAVGSLAIFATLLLIVDWRLSLVVAGGMILIRLVRWRMFTALHALSRQMSDLNQVLHERMLLSVLAGRLIRVFGQEQREQARFDEASEAVRRIILQIDTRSARAGPVNEVLQAGLFAVLLLGAGLYASGVSVPVLVTFLVLLQRMQPHIAMLEGARVKLAASAGPVGEVEWLLDAGRTAPATRGTRPFTRLEQAIRFENVELRYESRAPARPTLAQASFTIPAGQTTAILGASGSGKSTIVNLICRLLDPTSGAILVDGHPLASIDLASWRGRIGLAGQDIDLIEGTVAENIAYGAPDLSAAEIAEVARIADAHDFIRLLPHGYDTKVSGRGLNLSGGQRQRIGLARALARKPELLILDEATNAVDGLSETGIMTLIRTTGRRMTIIVVSHRASTLAACEAGVVIEDGVVVESGPLATLAAYRQMTGRLAI
ncbi:Heterocyst differentiation ATP-binding protein HepA [Methylobacterium crusticola]|uniref:Heterocyst differentiation ATP-binding protein HepA n=1 Tax=Methylobacterium crusticola TaxID=1697972 RepID=A0ABQ4QZ62_9HYPH|nr:Heterocyst differentiation ATP-binding protein HepA [Methylobacterium crusticola]